MPIKSRSNDYQHRLDGALQKLESQERKIREGERRLTQLQQEIQGQSEST